MKYDSISVTENLVPMKTQYDGISVTPDVRYYRGEKPIEFLHVDCGRYADNPQGVFGVLTRLAFASGIECFHSDLYYDALWLRDNWDEVSGHGFWYSVRQCGTAINAEKLINVTSGSETETRFLINLGEKGSER